MRAIAVITLIATLSGCGLFDSGVEWRGGPYALMWIDLPENVHVALDEGSGSWTPRVPEQVFAVGWDGRYLVAKQHPKGEKSITVYFIVDSKRDTPHASPEDSVIGPLSAVEFQQKSTELGLPPFTKILASLE